MNGNKKTEKDSTIFYEIERIEIVKNNMVIQGWAISTEGMKDVRFRVEDSKGESVKIKVTRKTRRDGVESDFGVSEGYRQFSDGLEGKLSVFLYINSILQMESEKKKSA